jgi:hypothetical protein
MTRHRNATICNFLIAFENYVGLYFGMPRTVHEVPFAGYAPAAVSHGVGGGDDFATVVGWVADSDEVDH